MGYYAGGGEYFMAGGFFSKLKRVGKGIISIPKKVVGLNSAVAARIMSAGRTSDLRSAAMQSIKMATGVMGAGGAGGRLGELMTPGAAPSYSSTDGTPPMAPVVVESSQGGSGIDPNVMMLLMMMLMQKGRR